jgi:squalene-hopene/tetraprenyl-beta-curcumene cyclase
MINLKCPITQVTLAALWLSSLAMPTMAAPSPASPAAINSPNVSLQHEVQHAIDQGVVWLEKNQDPKGFWSTADHPAVTALALVALRGAAADANGAGDPSVLRKGYDFVVNSVHPDGGIYRKPELITYNTAISMMALLAANNAEYRPIILKARQYLVGLQNDFGEPGKIDDVFDGGIGYGSHYKHSDMSNTMQALEALYYSRQLARDQGADTRDLNWQAAIHFIQSCQNLPEYNQQPWVADDARNKGGFVYYPGQSMAGETNLPSGRVALRSYGSISYAGLLSYIYADLKPDDARVAAVLKWLQDNYTLDENPGMGPQGLFYYFHTMAKALNLVGQDAVVLKDGRKVNWRDALALKLIDLQQKDGSWLNSNNRWWEKDPALVTSYALISLEIIKRKL